MDRHFPRRSGKRLLYLTLRLAGDKSPTNYCENQDNSSHISPDVSFLQLFVVNHYNYLSAYSTECGGICSMRCLTTVVAFQCGNFMLLRTSLYRGSLRMPSIIGSAITQLTSQHFWSTAALIRGNARFVCPRRT